MVDVPALGTHRQIYSLLSYAMLSRHWVFLAIIGGMEDSYSSEIVVWCVGTGICVGILVVCCKV